MALLLGCSRAARPDAAREPPVLAACTGSGSETIELTLVGATALPALRDAICDWFRSEASRVEFLPRADVRSLRVPAAPRASRRMAVELSSDTEARLWVELASSGAARELASWHVELPGRLDAAGVEVIAQALHSTLEAALASPTGMDEASATAAIPPASPGQPLATPSGTASAPIEPTLDLSLRTGLAYQFRVRGDEPVTHGPAATAELGLKLGTIGLGAFVSAGGFTSGRARFANLELALRGVALGAGVSARAALGSWIAGVALGPSVELISRELAVLDPDTLRELGEQPSRPRGFIGGELGIGFRSGPFGLDLLSLLRWQLSGSHYDVLDEERPITVMRPWRWQPGAAIEASYTW